MLQRGYIILIIGGALLISGIVISVLWAGSFASPIIRENTILNGVSIRPSDLVNTTIQVTDTSRPVSLAIHVGLTNNTSNIGQGQISNNTLRETIRNPNGSVVTSSEFTKQFFTTFKPDIAGKYTITIQNLGNTHVSIGVLAGNLPFVGANNQLSVNFFSGIIAGVILFIAGIIVLIAGIIILILDRRKRRPLAKT
jgi:hypothetical protein